MSSVLISSQTFTRGPEIARLAAEALGYRFIGDELRDQIAKDYAVAAADLRDALDRAPSLFGMADAKRRGLVAHLQAALAARLLDDELVFHLPYAHMLVPGVSHILRVRFVASVDNRAAILSQEQGLAPRKAEKRIRADDAARSNISQLLFGVEDVDERYDLVVDLDGREDQAAVDCIVGAIGSNAYAAMTYSTRRLQDLALAYRVRSSIVDLDPSARVEADQGVLEIRLWSTSSKKSKLESEVASRAQELDGVRSVDVRVFDDALRRARA